MRTDYDPSAPKKAANLSCNSELLRLARELDINLSALFERALQDGVKDRLAQRWLEHNREALSSYNKQIADKGAFSDGVRGF